MSTKAKAIALTIRPKEGITDMTIDKIKAYCIPLCEYYHFITEKTGTARHMHAALFLTKEYEVKYFNRDIKKKLLIPLLKALNDGSQLKHAYRGKSIYNADWHNHYCAKGDDTVHVGSYLPKDPAALQAYYRDTVKKTFHDYVHFDFENAYHEQYGKDHEPSLDDVNRFLCYQMYDARTRRVITEPRKVKNLIYSLHAYMIKSKTFLFHSNVQLHDQLLFTGRGTRYDCTECGYYDYTTIPDNCPHLR